MWNKYILYAILPLFFVAALLVSVRIARLLLKWNNQGFEWVPASEIGRAIVSNNINEVHEYLEHGGDPDVRVMRPSITAFISPENSAYGNSALMEASKRGLIEIVGMLIAYNANVNLATPAGATALHWAIGTKRSNVVALLIANKADIYTGMNGEDPPILVAAKHGSLEIVEQLLIAGANCNTLNEAGETALMLAAREGFAKVVEHLIKVGSDVHIRNMEGHTALWEARKYKYKRIVNLLIKAGASDY